MNDRATIADHRWMGAALALSERTRGATAPNPNVGCVIVKDGRVVARGWTQPGGRPHAEEMALAAAGAAARGATAYVTLEPCAHSRAGGSCSERLVAARVARVVIAARDPDARTDGAGVARLEAAGVAVTQDVRADEARRAMAGFFTRRRFGRPFVSLKLATSLDGCIAMASGESRWITGAAARAHGHLERSRHEAILVGRGTWSADAPALDVRLSGLEGRSPVRVVMSGRAPSVSPADAGAHGSGSSGDRAEPPSIGPGVRRDDVLMVASPTDISSLPGDHLLVEGGASAAAAFLAADLADRLLLYRAPIIIGGGRAAIGEIGLARLGNAHGRWAAVDARQLGSDRLEVYERVRD